MRILLKCGSVFAVFIRLCEMMLENLIKGALVLSMVLKCSRTQNRLAQWFLTFL